MVKNEMVTWRRGCVPPESRVSEIWKWECFKRNKKTLRKLIFSSNERGEGN